MIKVLSLHVTGQALSAEARFLLDAQGKAEEYRLKLVARLESEQAALDAALADGYSIVAQNVMETQEGKAFWFVLHKQEQPPATTITQAERTIDEVLKAGEYVILDTETTDRDGSEIVQIAVIDARGQTLLNTYVQPRGAISDGANAIHGITAAMVSSAPTFPELLPKLKALLTGRDVVVYNAVFDRKALHKSAEAWGLPKTEWKELARWHCAMERFARIYGDWNEYHQSYRWQKLVTAAAYYGVPANGAHTALGDCLMTLGVCQGMAEQMQETS